MEEKEYISREDNVFSLYSTYKGVKQATREIKKATDALVKDYDGVFWDKGLAAAVGRAILKHKDLGAYDTASRESWYNYIEDKLGVEIPYELELHTACVSEARRRGKG
jgi:hypothetical protein